MTDQTHIKPVVELAKKRRRYLIGKTAIFSGVTILSVISLITASIGLLVTVMSVVTLAAGQYAVAAALCVIAAGSLASAFYVGRISMRELKDSRRIARVPPVAEQIAALPAEDILVRGSDQPTATTDC